MQYYFWHLKNLKLDKGKLKGRQSFAFSNARDQILLTHSNPESFPFLDYCSHFWLSPCWLILRPCLKSSTFRDLAKSHNSRAERQRRTKKAPTLQLLPKQKANLVSDRVSRNNSKINTWYQGKRWAVCDLLQQKGSPAPLVSAYVRGAASLLCLPIFPHRAPVKGSEQCFCRHTGGHVE